jgi:hypothetical protein
MAVDSLFAASVSWLKDTAIWVGAWYADKDERASLFSAVRPCEDTLAKRSAP